MKYEFVKANILNHKIEISVLQKMLDTKIISNTTKNKSSALIVSQMCVCVYITYIIQALIVFGFFKRSFLKINIFSIV